MTPEEQFPWELTLGGRLGVDSRYATHAEAIEEANRRILLRHAFCLAPRTYGVYKRRDEEGTQ